jgi:hypothetical protein
LLINSGGLQDEWGRGLAFFQHRRSGVITFVISVGVYLSHTRPFAMLNHGKLGTGRCTHCLQNTGLHGRINDGWSDLDRLRRVCHVTVRIDTKHRLSAKGSGYRGVKTRSINSKGSRVKQEPRRRARNRRDPHKDCERRQHRKPPGRS